MALSLGVVVALLVDFVIGVFGKIDLVAVVVVVLGLVVAGTGDIVGSRVGGGVGLCVGDVGVVVRQPCSPPPTG